MESLSDRPPDDLAAYPYSGIVTVAVAIAEPHSTLAQFVQATRADEFAQHRRRLPRSHHRAPTLRASQRGSVSFNALPQPLALALAMQQLGLG